MFSAEQENETRLLVDPLPGDALILSCHPGKAATSKSKSSMKTVPPPPDSQADKVCKGANVFKDGTDPPIKEDSEYPDWLWELAENKKSYQDFSSDSTEYWRRLRKQKAHEKNVLMKQMGRV